MITVPEVKLKNIVDYCLDYLRDNYNGVSDKNMSYLYTVLEGIDLDGYDYFENAVHILTKSKANPRFIETHLFLNPNRFTLPTIHIGLPNENPGPHGLGFDTLYNFGQMEDLTNNSVSERAFNSRFNLVFTSDNTNEVLIMYYVMRACLIGNVEFLEMNGLRNPSFSGADILLNQDIAPQTYARALHIDCFYELTAPSFKEYEEMHKIHFNGQLTIK